MKQRNKECRNTKSRTVKSGALNLEQQKPKRLNQEHQFTESYYRT